MQKKSEKILKPQNFKDLKLETLKPHNLYILSNVFIL